MNALISKIPLLREFVRTLERRAFEKEWRRRNAHNETKVGDRFFPLEVVTVGKGTYGTITVQSLYVTPNEKLTIGNYVSIAPNVTFLLGVNHQIDTVTTFPFYSKLIERSTKDALTKGPVVIEDEVTIWGQVGTTSGITIGKKAVIMGQTGVTKSIEGGKTYFGTPIEESRVKLKELAYIKQIPNIIDKLNQS